MIVFDSNRHLPDPKSNALTPALLSLAREFTIHCYTMRSKSPKYRNFVKKKRSHNLLLNVLEVHPVYLFIPMFNMYILQFERKSQASGDLPLKDGRMGSLDKKKPIFFFCSMVDETKILIIFFSSYTFVFVFFFFSFFFLLLFFSS